MTSGQGSGPYGGSGDQAGQAGQPQSWSPPPGQPPGPPGGHPYGQPYGYPPAPPPMHQGAPPALERPTTVRAGIGAFVASLILGLVAAVATLGQLDTMVAQSAASAAPELSDEAIRTALVVGAGIALTIVALEVLVLWFAWQGRNWARIVLFVLGAVGILSGLSGLGDNDPLGGFVGALGVFQLMLTIAGVVLLALKPSSEWYRYRGWQRANGHS